MVIMQSLSENIGLGLPVMLAIGIIYWTYNKMKASLKFLLGNFLDATVTGLIDEAGVAQQTSCTLLDAHKLAILHIVSETIVGCTKVEGWGIIVWLPDCCVGVC